MNGKRVVIYLLTFNTLLSLKTSSYEKYILSFINDGLIVFNCTN
jgi:hypothetical protein